MPGDVDIAHVVGSNRTATIEAGLAPGDVALRLEAASAVRAGVDHAWSLTVGRHPGHVDAACSHGQMTASHGADGDCATGCRVDAHGFSPVARVGIGTSAAPPVEEVARFRVTAEVEHV